ncbi:type II CAAX endopeptidase family protein [Enterococcus hirae]|uniref:CPBP family intramembrane glutamic endopeptidase n=1 Tax=Enterococcus TaxID=1350 RepID=UPI001F06B381|nr:CPBP family intramembrane metalloprotease [Enterococcus hirae]
MVKWLFCSTYLLLTFIIPSLGVPSNIYFLFEHSSIFFFILSVVLFYSTLIQELKKISITKLLRVVISSFLILFIINFINTPISKSLSPSDLKNPLSFFFFSAITYGVILEEIVFRFCMINLQTNKKSQYIIMLISAFLFALVHGFGLVIFLSGILLGFVYIKTQNIWYSIITHSLYNCFAILVYLFLT